MSPPTWNQFSEDGTREQSTQDKKVVQPSPLVEEAAKQKPQCWTQECLCNATRTLAHVSPLLVLACERHARRAESGLHQADSTKERRCTVCAAKSDGTPGTDMVVCSEPTCGAVYCRRCVEAFGDPFVHGLGATAAWRSVTPNTLGDFDGISKQYFWACFKCQAAQAAAQPGQMQQLQHAAGEEACVQMSTALPPAKRPGAPSYLKSFFQALKQLVDAYGAFNSDDQEAVALCDELRLITRQLESTVAPSAFDKQLEDEIKALAPTLERQARLLSSTAASSAQPGSESPQPLVGVANLLARIQEAARQRAEAARERIVGTELALRQTYEERARHEQDLQALAAKVEQNLLAPCGEKNDPQDPSAKDKIAELLGKKDVLNRQLVTIAAQLSTLRFKKNRAEQQLAMEEPDYGAQKEWVGDLLPLSSTQSLEENRARLLELQKAYQHQKALTNAMSAVKPFFDYVTDAQCASVNREHRQMCIEFKRRYAVVLSPYKKPEQGAAAAAVMQLPQPSIAQAAACLMDTEPDVVFVSEAQQPQHGAKQNGGEQALQAPVVAKVSGVLPRPSARTVVLYCSRCLLHKVPVWHLDQPQRLQLAIGVFHELRTPARLEAFDYTASVSGALLCASVHDPSYLRSVAQRVEEARGEKPLLFVPPPPAGPNAAATAAASGVLPCSGCASPDGSVQEAFVNQYTLVACMLTAGLVQLGVKTVLSGHCERVFVATYPGGHHVGRAGPALGAPSQGFGIINPAALAAKLAVQSGASRVAVLDIDATHANGTEELLAGDSRFLAVSVHACGSLAGRGVFPGTGARASSAENVVNVALPVGADGQTWRGAVSSALWRVRKFEPSLLVVVVGFNGHAGDPTRLMELAAQDYALAAAAVRMLAEKVCGGRVVALLEGGYNTRGGFRSPFAVCLRRFLQGLAGTSDATASVCIPSMQALVKEHARRAALQQLQKH